MQQNKNAIQEVNFTRLRKDVIITINKIDTKLSYLRLCNMQIRITDREFNKSEICIEGIFR